MAALPESEQAGLAHARLELAGDAAKRKRATLRHNRTRRRIIVASPPEVSNDLTSNLEVTVQNVGEWMKTLEAESAADAAAAAAAVAAGLDLSANIPHLPPAGVQRKLSFIERDEENAQAATA